MFSSLEKFNAGNGRPNFSKPLDTAKILTKPDTSQGLERIDVRAARSNAHLGWLFKDGPPPTGDRYMLNSAALQFIPVDKMEVEGYAQWLSLFPNASPTPTAAK